MRPGSASESFATWSRAARCARRRWSQCGASRWGWVLEPTSGGGAGARLLPQRRRGAGARRPGAVRLARARAGDGMAGGGNGHPARRALQRAVLGPLALHPRSGLRRTATIDALWGDDPLGHGGHNDPVLRQPAYFRQVLGGGGQDGVLRWSSLTTGTYPPRTPGPASSIKVAFAELASRARDAYAAADSAAACDTYARALSPMAGRAAGRHRQPAEHPRGHRAEPAAGRGRHRVRQRPRRRRAGMTGCSQTCGSRAWPGAAERTRLHARLMIALAGRGHQAAALGLYEGIRGAALTSSSGSRRLAPS